MKIENLPFDINHNRVTLYNPDNPIEEHLKKKIDYVIVQMIRNIINIFDFEKDINYSTRLCELDDLSIDEMAQALTTCETLGFYYMYDYEEFQQKLEKVLDQLLSCGYFVDGWRESVINFIDWIDLWDHSIDSHFSPDFFAEILESNYTIKDMHKENVQNPPNSVVLLKHIKEEQYIVVQGGLLRKQKNADKLVHIQARYSKLIAIRVKEFLQNVDFWLEQSGGEFILDPHYYVIR